MLVSSGSRSGSWQSPQAALAAPLALAEQGEGEGEGCNGVTEVFLAMPGLDYAKKSFIKVAKGLN